MLTVRRRIVARAREIHGFGQPSETRHPRGPGALVAVARGATRTGPWNRGHGGMQSAPEGSGDRSGKGRFGLPGVLCRWPWAVWADEFRGFAARPGFTASRHRPTNRACLPTRLPAIPQMKTPQTQHLLDLSLRKLSVLAPLEAGLPTRPPVFWSRQVCIATPSPARSSHRPALRACRQHCGSCGHATQTATAASPRRFRTPVARHPAGMPRCVRLSGSMPFDLPPTGMPDVPLQSAVSISQHPIRRQHP
jgi:hypothetical protein